MSTKTMKKSLSRFFTGIKSRYPFRKQETRTAENFSHLNNARLNESLFERLQRHLDANADVHTMLASGIASYKSSQTQALIADARDIAFQISLIPHYEKYEPLVEAKDVLTGYWRSSWSNGGISECVYRTRLKALMLFIKSNYPSSAPLDMAVREDVPEDVQTVFEWWT